MLLNFQIFPNSSCLLLLIFNNIIAVRGHTLYDSNSQNSDTLVMFHIHEKYIFCNCEAIVYHSDLFEYINGAIQVFFIILSTSPSVS